MIGDCQLHFDIYVQVQYFGKMQLRNTIMMILRNEPKRNESNWLHMRACVRAEVMRIPIFNNNIIATTIFVRENNNCPQCSR